MKLHFEPNLDYQLEAIEAVCDLFSGQEKCNTVFTVSRRSQLDIVDKEEGTGNRLHLKEDEILKNVQKIQLRQGLPPSLAIKESDYNFTVEMETGTGKTYVYLRTIFELNKRYGFTKFIVVVPSVAIKEGVNKALEMTREHFTSLYAGAPSQFFVYDSAKPGQVRNFATSPLIQIMVVTVGAINKKDVNNLYKETEKMGGEKPIDLIRGTRPVLIVDEPQSVDGGLEGRGKEALDAMNPVCTLRYSATHKNPHHMIYRLNAVDAYERQLVKQIEVASATVDDAHNKAYIKLLKVVQKGGRLFARVELDILKSGKASRQEVTVQDGDQLQLLTGRPVYADGRIGEIQRHPTGNTMEIHLPEQHFFLQEGQSYGDVEHLAVERLMIARTIEEHLDKELRLRPQGIKVLSLFFIDSVHKYRQYDAGGHPHKGDYATLFEEEYLRASKKPRFQTLFTGVDLRHSAQEVHDGYFSMDKKGGWTDTDEKNQSSRDNAERAYNLIMKDKERLLDLNTPLKFIFSHSALKEGWDNPNVFQICAMRDIHTTGERRQTIGRGLRLCVNQAGLRVRDTALNRLTVVARESYEDFASRLQQEIEADTGIQFGIVTVHQFANLSISKEDGTIGVLGLKASEEMWKHLKAHNLIDHKGKVQDTLRLAIKHDTLALPAELEPYRVQLVAALKKVSGKLDVKDADARKSIPTRQAVLHSPEFQALWDRIKHKTTYRLDFDAEKLIQDCITAVKSSPQVKRTTLTWRKAALTITQAGVGAEEAAGSDQKTLQESGLLLPDILSDLQDRTQLTRRSLARILIHSDRLDDFKANPQQFIEGVAEAINRHKRLAIVDGIKYQRIGDQVYYAQELFQQHELTSYLTRMIPTEKSIYEHVVYDSESVERPFAEELERNTAVKVYAKLPGWFTVPTPLGTYNPDWAIVVEQDGEQRLYLVVETKAGLFSDDLRDKEKAKIACGKAHFEALATGDNPARYQVATKIGDILGG